MKYWLIKSEGECYSIDDLKKDKKTSWGEKWEGTHFARPFEDFLE